MILWSRGDNVIHQDWHQLRDPVDASSEGAVWGRAADRLALLLCLFQPFPGYRIYNIENTKLVCTGGLLEMGENLLDEN